MGSVVVPPHATHTSAHGRRPTDSRLRTAIEKFYQGSALPSVDASEIALPRSLRPPSALPSYGGRMNRSPMMVALALSVVACDRTDTADASAVGASGGSGAVGPLSTGGFASGSG